jgi:hypothetical protein
MKLWEITDVKHIASHLLYKGEEGQKFREGKNSPV